MEELSELMLPIIDDGGKVINQTNGEEVHPIELEALEQRSGGLALKSDVQLKLVNLMIQKDRIDKQLKTIKEQILTEMDNYGIYSIDMSGIKLTNVKGKPTKAFDNKLFERDNPKLYEEYCYYKEGTQFLKVTIKNGN